MGTNSQLHKKRKTTNYSIDISNVIKLLKIKEKSCKTERITNAGYGEKY